MSQAGAGRWVRLWLWEPRPRGEASAAGVAFHQLDSFRELRRLLDSVVAGLDKVTTLREQLSNRQQEIREFLARQAHADEKQWAMDFSRSVFNLMQRSPSSYAAVTQTVVAQATISRFAVVSLLS